MEDALTSPRTDFNIAYYITGHGYGHATRSVEVIRQFVLKSDQTRQIHVHIVSKLESSFFESSLLDIPRDSFTVHSRCLDAGAVQIDALSVDMIATLKSYVDTVFNIHDQLLDIEVTFLRDYYVKLVLCDATPLGCAAGGRAGIETIILSNFTWDYIYSQMLAAVASDLSDEIYRDAIAQCANDYCPANRYLRLPGYTPLPLTFREEQKNITIGPLVARCSTLQKSEFLKRYNIQVDDTTKLLALTFGGHDGGCSVPLSATALPAGWHCIVLGGGWTVPAAEDQHRFHFLPRNSFVPDVVAAVDVVLGKIGYGTVSECLVSGHRPTPLVYVPRSGWPEEMYLVNLVMSYRCAVCLSPESFVSGDWQQSIIDAANLDPVQVESPSGVDAARAIVDMALV